jgi:hypothetical protein
MARAASRQVRREAAAILRRLIDTVERGEIESFSMQRANQDDAD